VNSHNLLHKTQ